MKKGCLIALGAALLLVLVAAGSLTWIIARRGAPSIDRGSYVELDLSGELPEHLNEATLLGEDPLTMEDVSAILHYVADDSRVQGVVLRIEPMAVGWGKLEELREEVEDLKT